MREYRTTSIRDHMEDVFKLPFFDKDPEHDNTPAIDAYLHEGSCKLILVTGDNASGKSMLRRIISSTHSKAKVECIHVSQEGRSRSGVEKVFIYGSEEDESTGYISSKTVMTGIKTSRSRDKRHSIFFDEPDIGLSDNNAAGLGVMLREFILNPPEHLFMVFVASHNKVLMKELSKCDPWHLRMGDALPLSEWFNEPIVPADLTKLKEAGLARWHRINKVLKEMGSRRS